MAQGAVAKLEAGEGMDWFDLLERFQTAIATSIAAVLGFGGIILTIRSNAKLARKERHEIRTQEKQALIAALHSELDVINDRLNNHLAAVEELKIEEGIVQAIIVTSHPVFDACLSQLGLLQRGTITKLVLAYFRWDRLPDELKLYLNSKTTLAHKRRFLSREHIPQYEIILKSTHTAILAALKALEEEGQ